MGEARRRKLMAQRYCGPEQRADIARLVRSIDLVVGTGTCSFRALMGHKVLSWLGIPSRITEGGMLYRAGPDEMRDVVAFCGPQNQAYWTDHGALAHVWLTSGEDLIDFSVGDWQPQNEAGYYHSPYDRLPNGEELPPIQWTAPPLPEFWWQSEATFTVPWRPVGTPPLGAAWYVRGVPPEAAVAAQAEDSKSEPVRMAERILRERTEQLVAGWRESRFVPFTKKTFILSKPLARHGHDLNTALARHGQDLNSAGMRQTTLAEILRVAGEALPPELQDAAAYVTAMPTTREEAVALLKNMTITVPSGGR